MNGATTEPLASTSRPPNSAIMTRTGASQNFLRARRKPHSSATNSISAVPPLGSVLVHHGLRRRARRLARDPVAGGLGLPAAAHRVVPLRTHQVADRDEDGGVEQEEDDRAHDLEQNEAEPRPGAVQGCEQVVGGEPEGDQHEADHDHRRGEDAHRRQVQQEPGQADGGQDPADPQAEAAVGGGAERDVLLEVLVRPGQARARGDGIRLRDRSSYRSRGGSTTRALPGAGVGRRPERLISLRRVAEVARHRQLAGEPGVGGELAAAVEGDGSAGVLGLRPERAAQAAGDRGVARLGAGHLRRGGGRPGVRREHVPPLPRQHRQHRVRDLFNAKPTEHLLCSSKRFPKAAAPGRHEDAQPAPGCGPGAPGKGTRRTGRGGKRMAISRRGGVAGPPTPAREPSAFERHKALTLVLVNLALLAAALGALEVYARLTAGYDIDYYAGAKSPGVHQKPYGPVKINSMGFADDEFDLASTKPRVGYVGDSVNFGVGAGYGYRVSDILKRRFPAFEHWNLGAGVGTGLGATKPVERADMFKLGTVVYLLNLNDLEELRDAFRPGGPHPPL